MDGPDRRRTSRANSIPPAAPVEKISQNVAAVKGKRTYAICLCWMAYAIGGWLCGAVDSGTALEALFQAISMTALRAGVGQR